MFLEREKIRSLLSLPPPRGKLMVVGDLMLDRSWVGKVQRISPEAPVPVVEFEGIIERAGGAGNTALNGKNLGMEVFVVGVVGEDDAGRTLRKIFQENGIRGEIFTDGKRRTTIKTRVIGGHQQLVRLDVEDPHPIEGGMEERILHAVEDFLKEGGDVIILSDYGKGVVTPRLCQEIILRGKKRGVPTLVDPKGSSYEKYRSAYLLSPNQKELATATHVPPKDISLLLSKGEELRKGLDLTYIALTRSEEGITLLSSEGVKHFPAQARQVFDVTGAGDTVIATIAFGIVGGLPIEDSLRLANLSAGIVVGKVGTVPVPWEEFQEEVEKNLLPYSFQRKIVNRETLKNLVEIWRRKGETIVFTNGCFDLLHLGHIRYLEKARSLGDRLIVAINTDDSVRKLKGKGRPIIPEKERAELISSLEMVSLVTLFSEETPLSLIQEIRPDILVKGGDYTKEKIVGAKEVLQYGGKVEIIPYLEGYSTTLLLKKILKSSG